MTNTKRYGALIEWLDQTARWLDRRADLVGATRDGIERSVAGMTFEAPAGRAVRASVRAVARGIGSIEHELRSIRSSCARDASRLEELDRRVADIRRSAAVDRDPASTAVGQLKSYESDADEWERVHMPDAFVDELPLIELVESEETAATATRDIGWRGGRTTLAKLSAGAGPGFGTCRMDLDSMRLSAQRLARMSAACQDHQAAITRELSSIPPGLAPRLRKRLENSRRASGLCFERSARRLARQAHLIRSRAETPGLVDGVFVPLALPLPTRPPTWPPGGVVIRGRFGRVAQQHRSPATVVGTTTTAYTVAEVAALTALLDVPAMPGVEPVVLDDTSLASACQSLVDRGVLVVHGGELLLAEPHASAIAGLFCAPSVEFSTRITAEGSTTSAWFDDGEAAGWNVTADEGLVTVERRDREAHRALQVAGRAPAPAPACLFDDSAVDVVIEVVTVNRGDVVSSAASWSAHTGDGWVSWSAGDLHQLGATVEHEVPPTGRQAPT